MSLNCQVLCSLESIIEIVDRDNGCQLIAFQRDAEHVSNVSMEVRLKYFSETCFLVCEFRIRTLTCLLEQSQTINVI